MKSVMPQRVLRTLSCLNLHDRPDQFVSIVASLGKGEDGPIAVLQNWRKTLEAVG